MPTLADKGKGRSQQTDAAVAQSRQAYVQSLVQLLNDAGNCFGDVCWQGPSDRPIWAHKAILYSRSTHDFLAKFLPRSSATNALYDASAASSDLSLLSSHQHQQHGIPFDELDRRAMSPASLHSPLPLDSVRPIYIDSTDTALLQSLLDFIYTADAKGMFAEAFNFFLEDNSSSPMFRSASQTSIDMSPVDRLSQDLLFMWRSKLYADVQIQLLSDDAQPEAANNDSVQSFLRSHDASNDDAMTISEDTMSTSFVAHRMILSRVPYFGAFLLHRNATYSDSDSRFLTLPSPPFTPASLHFTLGYIYCGTLAFSSRTFDLSTAFAIWTSAVYLSLDTLKTEIESRIHDMAFLVPPSYTKPDAIRCARIYRWSLAPDVSCPQLQADTKEAITKYFGEAWQEAVGKLEQDTQQELVNDVCASLKPANLINSLRQYVQAQLCASRAVLNRKDSEWADNILAMLEPVHSQIAAMMGSKASEVVISAPFIALLEGRSFSSDILQISLEMIGSNLQEAHAAMTYQAIVGNVLLREAGIQMDARMLVEDCRKNILKYLKARWMNVRSLKGFDGLDSWCLKEIADELEMKPADLLWHETVPQAINLSPNRKSMAASIISRRKLASEAAKDEAGASSLRASVIQKNAAIRAKRRPSDAASDTRSIASSTATPLRKNALSSSLGSGRPPNLTSSTKLRRSSVSSSTSTSTVGSVAKPAKELATNSPAVRSRGPSAKRPSSAASSPAPDRLHETQNGDANSLAPSVRSASVSLRSAKTPPRSRTTSVSSQTSTGTTASTRPHPDQRPPMPALPSPNSMSTMSPSPNGKAMSRRSLSVSSVKSGKTIKSTKTVNSISPSTNGSIASGRPPSVASSRASIATSRTSAAASRRTLSIATNSAKSASTQKPRGGTSLNVGIRCIVSFPGSKGKATGSVLYLGPVATLGPGQWLGVQLDSDSVNDANALRELDWTDGEHKGVKYFALDNANDQGKKGRGIFCRPSQVMFLF